jgi:hypothetical protein
MIFSHVLYQLSYPAKRSYRAAEKLLRAGKNTIRGAQPLQPPGFPQPAKPDTAPLTPTADLRLGTAPLDPPALASLPTDPRPAHPEPDRCNPIVVCPLR